MGAEMVSREGDFMKYTSGCCLCVTHSVVFAALCLAGEPPLASAEGRFSDYIRPFVGTKGEGNTYPGPSAPFGMVQLGPDTDKTNWATASGYEYTDPTILGFSLTHLS